MAEVAGRADRAFVIAALSPPSAKTRAEAWAFVDPADRRPSARCWKANSRAPATKAHPFLPQRIIFRHEDFTLLNSSKQIIDRLFLLNAGSFLCFHSKFARLSTNRCKNR